MSSVSVTGRLFVFIFFLAISALFAPGVSAVPIVVHQGTNDPASEGWTLNMTGAGSVSAGTEVTGSGSYDFWNIQDTDTSGSTTYTQALSAGNLSGDWTLEASLRVISSPVVPSTVDIPGLAIIVADGMNYWSFYIGEDRAGPVSNTIPLSLANSFFLDTMSDYNQYDIFFSQNGAGAADDTADFYINNILVFDDVGRSGLYSSASMLVWMGPISTAGTGNANWEMFRFDDGLVALPEPGTLSLFGMGLLGGLAFMRRKRKTYS